MSDAEASDSRDADRLSGTLPPLSSPHRLYSVLLRRLTLALALDGCCCCCCCGGGGVVGGMRTAKPGGGCRELGAIGCCWLCALSRTDCGGGGTTGDAG